MKQYLETIIRISAEGKITPLAIVWDSQTYEIDKITGMGAPMHPQGKMCICLISGHKRELYYEPYKDGLRWFLWKGE